MLPLILSSDSHLFEPPDLWQTRIDAPFRDRAPRIERIDGGDHVVVEADQILSGIGLISNAGARFEAPETISPQGRFEDVHRGGYDPEQHLKDVALDEVAGEVLSPSQGLFYFNRHVAQPADRRQHAGVRFHQSGPDRRRNGIIAGHDRVLAARKLGMAEVPCIELIASRVGHSAGHAGNRPPASLMRSISTRCRSRTFPSRSACRCACPLFKPGAGTGESRGRPLGRSPDPRADSTVNPA